MNKNINTDFKNLQDLLKDFIDQFASNSNDATIKTGFNHLDNVLNGGLSPGELTLLAARPGMGKTAFANEIALHNAKAGKKVCIFSFDLSAKAFALRLLAREAGIDTFKLHKKDFLDKNDIDKLKQGAHRLNNAELFICDTAFQTENLTDDISHILLKIDDVDLVIVDNLKLAADCYSTKPDEIAMALASYHLRNLALKLNIPVLCCANLPRTCENRANMRPKLSDLYDLSTSVENNAHTIIFLYRDSYYKDGALEDECEVIVAKNNVFCCYETVTLKWNGKFTMFSDII